MIDRILLAGLLCAAPAAAQTVATPSRDVSTRSVILPATGIAVAPRSTVGPAAAVRPGDVTLDYPGVDIQAVAKAVLGDLLGLQYSVAPDLHTPVSLLTPRPIARADVLPYFEDALRTSGLALVRRGTVVAVVTIDQARSQAALGDGSVTGFVTESIALKFVNADQLKALIAPILPGVVVQSDPARNTLSVAGTTGQRAGVRELVRQFDVNWLRNTSFGLFVPQRTDSRLIVPELERLLNAENSPTRGLVRLIAMDNLNGVLAVAIQPQYLEDVRRFVELLDREGDSNQRKLFVYRVQNGRSSDLARTINGAFGFAGSTGPATGAALDTQSAPRTDTLLPAPAGPDRAVTRNSPTTPGPAGTAPDPSGDVPKVKITSDDVNNALIVFATPRDYAVIEDALRKLDILPYQVMIEAAIAEVTLTNDLRYGVQYLFDYKGGNAGLTQADPATGAATGLPSQFFPGFSAIYSKLGSITATLNALEGMTTVKVISAPKLMVLNNQTASLQVGNQVPIATATSTSTIGTNAPIVNSVEYRDTGVILRITPRVNANGLVLLDVAQEVSSVTNTTSSTINSPTISTRKVATSIAVQDGQTISLGGLITDSRDRQTGGLPFLSRIPFIGPLLFGNYRRADNRTELLILLRPRVVRNADDARALTDELQNKLRGLQPLLPKGAMP